MERRTFLKNMGKAMLTATSLSAVPLLNCGWNRKPNFVCILIDDMGWKDLGCYGSQFYETPNIDHLASEGMKFTNAYAACTVCSPTRASILTGKYPARLHLTDWIPGHKRANAKMLVPSFNQELPLKETTVAEILHEAGYVSASIGKWHLGKEPFYPEKQGFDINLGGTDKGQPPSYFAPYRISTIPDGPEGECLTDRLADEAIKFIETNQKKPFFLYWPHFTVHTPLQAKSELIQRYETKINPSDAQNNATYAAMIQSLDEAVGRLLTKLKELDLEKNTVVIFMSDNGGLARVTSNLPLRAGKGSAYEGGHRTPMFIKWPDVIPAGSTCDTPVISVDFFPTILEMAGLKLPASTPIDGLSLLPLLKQKGDLGREAIYWHYPHYHPGGATPYSAIRKGEYKLIEYLEDGRLELYHLKEDIGERNDLSAKLPDKTRELHEQLKKWRIEVNAQIPVLNPDYDGKELGTWEWEIKAKK